ncbi:MAG: tetratricopeptide repeat protein [Mariniblastus sp.]|nr:tetratricopeptide repeat protein [Mariniblastus sp.]
MNCNQSVRISKLNSMLGPVRLLMSWGLCVVLLMQVGCNMAAQQNNLNGKQFFELGQYPTAINEFQKALAKDPNNADALYNLGASLYAQGKQANNKQLLDQSEQLYRQAIAANDQHVDAHRGLAGLLIETNREKYAFDLINQWQTRYPASTDPIVELARLYQEYGDNRRATDLLADALKLNPNDIRTLKAMGHVREVQGQTLLALDNYVRVLQIDRQQSSVAQRVASLQSQMAKLPVPNDLGGNQGITPNRYGAVAPYLQR